MTKVTPIFKDVVFWLNKICILPYTDEELDAIGCLGFDMKHNQDFAYKYKQKLMQKSHLITENKHIAFAELNLQIYREVLQQPDMKQIPDWITTPSKGKTENNTVKARIIRMYQNIQKDTADTPVSPKTR